MNVSSSHAFTVYEVSAIAKDLGESALSRELVEKINDSAGVDTKIQAEASARIAAVAAAEKKAADALAAKARELGSKITSVENIANGQTQRIETLTAAGRTAAAALEEEKKARADGDAAEARARQAVAADLEGQIASVSREQTVLSEKDKSRASEIAALSTRVGQTEGSVTELRQSSVTRAQVETIAQDAVSAKFQNTDTRNDNRPPSWYWEHYPRRTASEFKSVGAVGLGGSGYAVVETVVPWENVSGGQIVQTAYLSDGAVKRRVSDAVRASQGGRWVLTRDAWGQWAAVETTAGAQAKADAVRAAAAAAEKKAADAAADLNTFKLAQANKDTATAKRIDTLTTTVNNSSATVQATAQSIKGLEAQYTVKVDVNGHVAGYGLATTLKDGKPTSAFIVSADRFGIGAAGAGDIYPFTVDTQTQTVGINGKLIVNGKAIIDKLNAGDISADKLQANSIGANLLKAGAVTAEKLAAKAVTAEKLQVDKLSAISADMGDITAGSLNIGKGRFTVDAQGTMTIRADAKRNVGLKISNEAVEVYDEAGVLRVRLGKLE